MDGLEISEIAFSALHKPLRIEAEYYRKSYIKLENLIKSKHSVRLSTLTSKITDGTHYTPSYVESGIPFLSALNVLENRLDIEAGHQFISLAEHNELYRRCDPVAGDILLRKVGVGPRWAAVVPEGLPAFSVFVSVALLRPRTELIAPEVLAAFINSRNGQTQLLRVQKGASQPDLHLEDIRDIAIPIFEHGFQRKITTMHQQAIEQIAKGAVCLKDAEQILLSAMGLENWQPCNQHTAIKRFSQSFASSGRLDAEYYQPKYDEILARLQVNQHGCVPLADCFEQNRSLSKLEKSAYHYIEIGDVSVSNGQATANCIETKELPPNARIESRKDELIVSKVRPYRGAIAIVESDETDLLVSTAFTVLRETGRYKKEVLQILLRTKVYKELLMQPSVGTSYPVIRDEDVMALPIPDLPIAMQQQIANKVQSAQAARRQSQQLLELAKQTVERAIESSEAEALDWLQTQLHQIVG